MKRIEDLDPNFRLCDQIPEDTVFRSAWEKPMRMWGLVPNEQNSFCRLPLSFLPECSEGVQHLAWHTAGGVLRFATDSPYVTIAWELSEKGNMPHKAATAQSGLGLFEETDCGSKYISTVIPQMDNGCGCLEKQCRTISLPAGMHSYALYLPLYNGIRTLLIGLKAGSDLAECHTPKYDKPIVFYGSSITQGACSTKVGSCYTSILARRLDAAQINLGFSGNGKGETNMAEYIASLPMSAFVLDYDHNAPTPEHLRETHEQFYRFVREKNPDLPIVMMSKPDYDREPAESAIRRDIILRTYLNAVENGDTHVRFLDGSLFFGHEDRDLCTVDGCHPTDLGFWRMANCIEPALRELMAK